jgi:hypothetical protein
MSDRQSTNDLKAATLGSALRELPLAMPPSGGWEALAMSLRAHGLVRDGAGDGEIAAQVTVDNEASSDSAARTAATTHTDRSRAARPRRGRRWVPAALAAGLALFAIALVPMNHDTTVAPPTTQTAPNPDVPAVNTATDRTTALAELRSESGRIEEWLRTLKADETPLDGRSLMAATEIEDMIGLIDLQLAAGSDTGSDTHALWRDRVELLRDLAAVRTTYSLAGTGIAANGNVAAPDNWNNL